MKRILAIILLVISILLLYSCDFPFGTPDDPQNPGNNNQNPGSDEPKYSSLVYTVDGIDLSMVRLEMLDIVGQGVTVNHISTAPSVNSEIVFGDSSRAVTVAAKEALSAELSKASKKDTGYIIYHDGTSIAVYWMHPDMQSIAITDFLNTCVIDNKLVLNEGTVISVLYNEREFETDKYWLAIEAEADESVVAALRALNSYFNGAAIVDFYANLWDGERGGFYYTISARDNVGYFPDMESTKQIIEGLKSNGAITDANTAFPTEIKEKILNFVISTQSAADGYFYHPQWPQSRNELQTDRYGRDMGHATDIIALFKIDTDGDGVEDKQYPRFCAPNGVKCAAHSGSDEKCSFPQSISYYSSVLSSPTVSLALSRDEAVSRVFSSVDAVASVSSHPDYSSREAFSAWLEQYNSTIKDNSGKAHNLSAIRDEITQYGYEDIVLDHLDRVQKEVFDEQMENGETPTGLWQRNVDYNAVWGLLKYSGYYNAGKNRGRAIGEQYFPYIIKTCISVIKLAPDGDYASNDLFNQWDSIDRVFKNAQDYYGDKLVAELRNILRENAADLVSNSLAKIEDLSIGNGTFALNSDGTSPKKMYGVPISPGIVEGNVNSTNIICAMYNSIFTALGYTTVPLFNLADGERFINTILTLPPIDKIEKDAETTDFESGELPTSISNSFNNSSTTVSVVDDPYDTSYDKALLFDSPSGESGDTLYFTPDSFGSGCFIFESSICISSETVIQKSSENIVQLKIGDNKKTISYLIILQMSGNDITLLEATNTSDKSTYRAIGTASCDEYFKLRIEYYVSDSDTDTPPMIKVWLNDELVSTSSAFYGSHDSSATPADVYTAASFYCLKSPAIKLYIDDCYFSIEDKVYSDGDEITDSRS